MECACYSGAESLHRTHAAHRLAIVSAPVLFVLLWSTGFIVARYGLPYIEPMTFLALRMTTVVVLMQPIAFLSRAPWPSTSEVGHSMVVGLLVHGIYLGGVFTAIAQGVPAGISALVPGLQPILTSTIANRFMGETVTRVQWLGLALGLLGVLLVLHDREIVLAGSALGWGASLMSLIGITLGAAMSTGGPAISCNTPASRCSSACSPSLSKRASCIGPAN